jgi:predicted membrane channel-forming protein YqfA (hemolysin III family)
MGNGVWLAIGLYWLMGWDGMVSAFSGVALAGSRNVIQSIKSGVIYLHQALGQ